MDPEVIDDPEVEEPSLRDVLEESIEEHDPQHELIPASTESPASPSEGADSPGAAQPPAADPSAPKADGAPPEAPPQVPASTALNAPAQWKPGAKELWNTIPRAIQEEIHRREGDSMRLIGSVGPKIRIADEVQQHMAPFAEKLSQNGVGPSAFLGDVFSSIKILAGGNPEQRATVVANIVQSYGVDVRDLDRILTHRLNQPPEVYQAREAITRANIITQQHQAGLDQQSAQEADKVLVAFAADPKHEFYEDVRLLMADLIDSGRAKNLEEAYSAAVWANGDTRKILLQREAQTRAQGKSKRASVARRASSSIHGTPSIPGPAVTNSGEMGLRDAIEAAYDEHSSL
jgi:hypothetical protein